MQVTEIPTKAFVRRKKCALERKISIEKRVSLPVVDLRKSIGTLLIFVYTHTICSDIGFVCSNSRCSSDSYSVYIVILNKSYKTPSV